MSLAIPKNLEVAVVFDIGNFVHKSLSINPDGGDYNVEVSNDGNTWHTIAATITVNTLLRTGPATTDLPHAAQKIRITENSAGTAPVFAFLGMDSA